MLSSKMSKIHQRRGTISTTAPICPSRTNWIVLLFCIYVAPSASFVVRSGCIQKHTTQQRKEEISSGSSTIATRRTNLFGSQQQQQQQQQQPKTKPVRQPQKKGKQKFQRRKRQSGNKRGLAQAKALNKALVSCENSADVLKLLASTGNALTGLAGGGSMNSVNFSTAIHRIARHAVYNRESRAKTLSDARFALFLCSLSEALGGMDYTQSLGALQQKQTNDQKQQSKKITFGSREVSNIAWAIAKLRIAPPNSVLPVDTSESIVDDLLQSSLQLRNEILSVAKERREQSNTGANADISSSRWVPTLSKLSGLVMDEISRQLLVAKSDVNSQEWANLLWAFATADRADPKAFDNIANQLLRAINQQLEKGRNVIKPQELSNSVWAFATAGFHGPTQESLLEHLADLMDSNPEFIAAFKPQELSNTIWGIATILSNKRSGDKNMQNESEDLVVARICRHVAKGIASRVDEFKSQEVSNTLWAFATLGFGYDESIIRGGNANDYIILLTDDAEGDQALVAEAFRAVSKSAVPRLKVFRSQELNNLAWAFSRLGEQEEAVNVFNGVGNEFQNPRRNVSPQDVGSTLWSFASKEYFNEDVYKSICSRLTWKRCGQFKPQEISNTLWALATAKMVPQYRDAFDTTLFHSNQRPSLAEFSDDPVTLCFAVGAEELMRRPYEFKEQEIKDVLWSFSKIGLRHPILFRLTAEHLVGREEDSGNLSKCRSVDNFSPQGIGNLCWSIARQAQLVEVATERLEGGGSGKTGRLAIYSTSCIDFGEVLLQRLMRSLADAAITKHDRLSRMKPQDISNTAWAMGILGLWHKEFFELTAEQVIERTSRLVNRNGRKGNMPDYMDRFKGQEIANIVWAFAVLNHPMHDVVDAIASYILHICRHGDRDGEYDEVSISKWFKRQELANTVWSCAVAGRFPPELMRLLYTGLIGSSPSKTPQYLNEVYGDDGLQRPLIMSLLYVQMAMDVEVPDNDLVLPANFPDGWDSDTQNSLEYLESGTETPSMMSLSSSKLQVEVSAALNRIGFDHVEEHTIGLEELVHNHGIKVSSRPLEILSIDVANLEKKIGIEVDGPAHFVHVLDEEQPQDQHKSDGRGFAKLVNGSLVWQFLDTRQYMNGPTALKERLLTHLGWKLLHLPYWEWSRLDGDEERENEYLEDLLS